MSLCGDLRNLNADCFMPYISEYTGSMVERPADTIPKMVTKPSQIQATIIVPKKKKLSQESDNIIAEYATGYTAF
jgi:hypothetical protein